MNSLSEGVAAPPAISSQPAGAWSGPKAAKSALPPLWRRREAGRAATDPPLEILHRHRTPARFPWAGVLSVHGFPPGQDFFRAGVRARAAAPPGRPTSPTSSTAWNTRPISCWPIYLPSSIIRTDLGDRPCLAPNIRKLITSTRYMRDPHATVKIRSSSRVMRTEQLWGTWWRAGDPSRNVDGLLHPAEGEFPRLELKMSGTVRWFGSARRQVALCMVMSAVAR